MNISPILAATLTELPDVSRGSRLVAWDLSIVLLLVGLVVTAIVVWAVFIRGPRKHPEEVNRTPLGANPNPYVTVTDDGRERRKKKRRERRRDHRQRNPTLDQTGGLPPPRDPQESPSV
jgi:hypothetical protein